MDERRRVLIIWAFIIKAFGKHKSQGFSQIDQTLEVDIHTQQELAKARTMTRITEIFS